MATKRPNNLLSAPTFLFIFFIVHHRPNSFIFSDYKTEAQVVLAYLDQTACGCRKPWLSSVHYSR